MSVVADVVQGAVSGLGGGVAQVITAASDSAIKKKLANAVVPMLNKAGAEVKQMTENGGREIVRTFEETVDIADDLVRTGGTEVKKLSRQLGSHVSKKADRVAKVLRKDLKQAASQVKVGTSVAYNDAKKSVETLYTHGKSGVTDTWKFAKKVALWAGAGAFASVAIKILRDQTHFERLACERNPLSSSCTLEWIYGWGTLIPVAGIFYFVHTIYSRAQHTLQKTYPIAKAQDTDQSDSDDEIYLVSDSESDTMPTQLSPRGVTDHKSSDRSDCENEDEKNIHVTEESKSDEDDLDSKETTSGLDDDFSRTQIDRSEEPISPPCERDNSEVDQRGKKVSYNSEERSRRRKERIIRMRNSIFELNQELSQSNIRLGRSKINQ